MALTPQQAAVMAMNSSLAAHAGVEVEYQQGNTTLKLTATPAMRRRTEMDAEGNRIVYSDPDWIVDAEDMEGLTPKRHDKLRHTHDGVTDTYQVMPTSGGDVYRRVEPLGTVLRIFTRLMGTA